MIRGLRRPAIYVPQPRTGWRYRHAARTLRVESLESRQVSAVGSVPPLPTAAGIISEPSPAAFVLTTSSAAQTAATTSLGQQVARYLTSKIGTRIGGGECSHMAIEALRATGANFIEWYAMPPLAHLTQGSQVAGKRFQVGDVVQLDNAAFSTGRFIRHHTQVVAAVDARGRITKVFEQNIGGNRTVHQNNATDLATLSGGTITIYRPTPRVDKPGRLEFTVVNNTGALQTYTRHIGSFSAMAKLDKANTVGSYKYYWSTVPAGASASLQINGSSVTIRNAGAYELFASVGGRVAIRMLT